MGEYTAKPNLPGRGMKIRSENGQLKDKFLFFLLIIFIGYRTCQFWMLGRVRQCLGHSPFPLALHIKEVLTLLTLYLHVNFGEWSGISFVDSTRGRVCDNKRISSHRVFREHAACSKTSMGWFYGFKLHLIINEKGDLLGFEVSPGNTDDRQPLWELSGDVFFGSLIGDKGYISKDLREHLSEAGINLVYKVRKSMKPYNRHYSRQQTGTHQSLSSPLLMMHPRRNGNARLHAKGRNSSLGISPKRCIFNSSSLGLRRIRVFKTYWVMP